jgi:hypothetical protein
MSSDPFLIQVLKKDDYTSQCLVSIPKALSPLNPESIRVKSTLISLTRNNLTYARLGHLLGWWDVHPLPTNIPASFSDSSLYGRISAWGYGTVLESNIPAFPIGSEVFGYLPIGTLPVDLHLQPFHGTTNQWRECSPHRAKQLNAYNRYIQFAAPKTQLDVDERKSRAYDALMQVLFETAYNLSRLTFAWEGPAIHPFTGSPFPPEDADISDALVIITPAGSKTALALAQQLRSGGRPKEFQPRRIIGVGSNHSRALAMGSGFYDLVLDYGGLDKINSIGIIECRTKAVVVDVGAREGEAEKWVQVLRKQCESVLPVIISSNAGKDAVPLNRAVRVNASVLRDRAMQVEGETEYLDRFLKAWDGFKRDGGVKGLEIVRADGMAEVGKAWSSLCKGEVGPEVGLVFEL